MADDTDETKFYTRDRSLATTLIAVGSVIVGHKILGTKKDGFIVTLIFSRDDALTSSTLRKWFRNEPIPLDDARRFIIAGEIFNSYIRGDFPNLGG